MSRPRPHPRTPGRDLAPFLLVVLVLVVFGRVVTHEFVQWDDTELFTSNPRFNPPTWSGIGYFWTHRFINNYMPLMATVWGVVGMAAYLPDGATPADRFNPYVFHAVNLLLHLGAALAAYAALRQVVEVIAEQREAQPPIPGTVPADDRARRSRAPTWSAAVGAAVFAAHPIQVDPVAWVSAMNVPLCGLFVLVATWQYLRFARATRGGSHARARRHYALAIVAFTLALLSKPLGIAAPLGLIAIDRWLLGRPWRRVAWSIAPWLLLAGLAGLTAVAFRGSSAGVTAVVPPAWQRVAVAGDAVAFYLRQIAWPAQFLVDYGRTPEWVLRGAAWGWTTATAAITVALWSLRRRWPAGWVGFCVYIAGLFPTLGLVPFDFQAYSTVADRFAYHAMFGIGLMVAGTLAQLRGPRVGTVAVTVAALAVVGLAIRSFVQVGVWRDSDTLFRHVLSGNPDSFIARNNLASWLIDQGRHAEALPHAERAIAARPDFSRGFVNLGLAREALGRPEEAMRAYRQAVQLNFPDPQPYINLAGLLAEGGRFDEAIALYEVVLERQPGFPPATAGLKQAQSERSTRQRASTAPAATQAGTMLYGSPSVAATQPATTASPP